MKAFALDEFGVPGSIHDLPAPEPAAGQVKVKIAAAGLNPFDASVASGRLKDLMEHRFPLVTGTDGSGTVEAIGEGVTEWSVGDDVFGSVGKTYLGEGTLAEFTTLAAGTVARKPSGKVVVDRQPNSASARDASTLRRGWPSGWDESKRMRPANPVASATSWASSEIRISSPLPRLTGSALS